MRSVGLDWAVDPGDRAAVVLEKCPGALIKLVDIASPVDDEKAKGLCKSKEHDVVAVDIPFAWPRDFREFVSKWIPFDGSVNQPPDSCKFRYRRTDRFVHEKTTKWPLSVSSNLFALGARQWAEVVQSGNLNLQIAVSKTSLPKKSKPYIIEVYPGATLKAFENHKLPAISGQSTRIIEKGEQVTEKTYSYKTDEITRRTLVEAMISAFRIEANEKMRSRLVDTGKRDHAADAFIAALTGLIFLGAIDTWTVIEPKNDQLEDAYAEGWIFFPEKASGVGNS